MTMNKELQKVRDEKAELWRITKSKFGELPMDTFEAGFNACYSAIMKNATTIQVGKNCEDCNFGQINFKHPLIDNATFCYASLMCHSGKEKPSRCTIKSVTIILNEGE